MKKITKAKTKKVQKAVLEEMGEFLFQEHHPGKKCSPCSSMGDLCLDWLQVRYGTVKKSTYSAYQYCVKVHIFPFFENILLSELNRVIICTFVNETQGRGLANSTVHFIFSIFRFIVKYGVECKLLDKEILSYCSVSSRRPESRVLTVQESTRMKEYLLEQNTVFSIAILLCRGTGIRIGELCGLKWGDIDFRSNTFRVRRTISRIPNPNTSEGQPRTILYIRTPKSYTSSREIPIPDYLIDLLKAMSKKDNLYLLTGSETCTEPRNVQKKFKTILRHCGMQDCNFHAMRHGFATACLEKGIDCKTVSAILGHASTRTTMEIYVHTSLKQKQNCVNSID